MILGCDISHWQGKRIDFNKMKSAGMQFVFIKATDFAWKTGVDDTFLFNLQKAKEAGIMTGAYHWWICDSKFGVAEQIGLMKMHIAPVLRDLDLPITLDVEVGGTPKSLWSARLMQTCYEIENWTGRKPIIYTSPTIWKGNALAYETFAQYHLWIANYKVTTPYVPLPWTKWTFWQYAAGVTDPVANNSENYGVSKYDSKALDTNWFNGTLEQLKEL